MALRKRPNAKTRVNKLEEQLDAYIAKAPPEEKPDDYYRPHTHHKEKAHVGRTIILIVIGLLIIGGGVAGGYLYLQSRHTKQTSAAVHSLTPHVAAEAAGSNTSATYTAKGNDLNLSFTYPTSWSATPATGTDTTDQPITLTSPLTSLTDASSKSVIGKVIIRIRPVNTTVNELESNSPVAALPSVQFAYSQPTANQYQYPYLSFVHFSNSAGGNQSFGEVIITGVQQFNAGDSVDSVALGGLDPIITASFTQCQTQTCAGSNETVLNITNDQWQNTALFQETLKIFESLQVH